MFGPLRSTVTWAIILVVAFTFGSATALQRNGPKEEIENGPLTFAQAGASAAGTMTQTWFEPGGRWKMCLQQCKANNTDWGADNLTYALFLRWFTTHDEALVPYFRDLERSAPLYGPPCRNLQTCDADAWSDVPMWDSIAASRDFAVTGDAAALAKAKAAFSFVDGSAVYASGACPAIAFQRPGGVQRLKTLETDSNYVKAALLLSASTREPSYLSKARSKYAAVRRYFLDPHVPLYTVYVFDGGSSCVQTPHRFFASVNGNMIVNGLLLYAATKKRAYFDDALATGRAAATALSDPNGVFADLQAENDVVEPLVEGMYGLATTGQQRFARAWILRNASAAAGEMESDGSYGRFFDGPVSRGLVTAFQTNGGFTAAFAAADLGRTQALRRQSDWTSATYVSKALSTGDSVTFRGSAIAFIGTIGDRCCEAGHARVFVDGAETVDGTGIWQNKSSTGLRIANSILFAWRWAAAGRHTIFFAAGAPNAKEGNSYLNLAGYFVR